MRGYLLNLLGFAVIAFGCVFWWKTQGVRQLAYRAAQRRCDELGLQLLDQSVTLKGLGVRSGRGGKLSLRRKFVFEFSSTGEERYEGEVWIVGRRLERIELAPHRL